ncbi:MAG: sulfatase-like hydrolase/transferase, partial [Deltaproteobacteria bacterium]|nr:sulfatase-like hydrolase/transferase [Deltaproteobacteria bacterium]
DNLRYDCIGYQPDKQDLLKYDVLKYLETPTLDHIASESICFTSCISPGTYTTSVHASVLTGLYPPRHGVRSFYTTKLHRDISSLAEILKVF